jgi:hypothetical protein
MVLELEFIPCLIKTTSEERNVSEIDTLSFYSPVKTVGGRSQVVVIHHSSTRTGKN